LTDEDHANVHEGLRKRSIGRLAAVALTVVLVLFAANQAGTLEIVTGTDIAVALKGPQLAQAVSNGLGPRQPLYLDPPFKGKGWAFDGTRVVTPTNMIDNLHRRCHPSQFAAEPQRLGALARGLGHFSRPGRSGRAADAPPDDHRVPVLLV